MKKNSRPERRRKIHGQSFADIVREATKLVLEYHLEQDTREVEIKELLRYVSDTLQKGLKIKGVTLNMGFFVACTYVYDPDFDARKVWDSDGERIYISLRSAKHGIPKKK